MNKIKFHLMFLVIIYLVGVIFLFFSGSMIGIEITKKNWHYYLVIWPLVIGALELILCFFWEKFDKSGIGKLYNSLPSLVKGALLIILVMITLFLIMYIADKFNISI
ncbi:MAG: hypothetical protein CES88_10405 [Halobacteriovorax sp. JY17]|nr:MAG: hypothetical protein CES88_10405 [Halobacteriovorax sp. JY17]